jgi:hypothetical protein
MSAHGVRALIMQATLRCVCVCVFVCRYVGMSVCRYVMVCVCVSLDMCWLVHLFVCLSVCLSACVSVSACYLFIHPSNRSIIQLVFCPVGLFVCVWMFVCTRVPFRIRYKVNAFGRLFVCSVVCLLA